MNRVEKLEEQIRELTGGELARFRSWFAEYDWTVWDRELEEDVKLGKLDDLANDALADHEAGRTEAV